MNTRILAAFSAAAVALLCGCAALPPLDGRTETRVLADTGGTALGTATAALAAPHPGKSGIHPLLLGTDAFAARMALAGAAQRSIDAQYYIWHADHTGLLLFDALAKAARRGVRVRILLDDQNSRGAEDILAALGTDPNVEVRLYNPFAQRGARFLDYLGDFSRVNRRMHNKAFIADNQAAVVGGRNIGNEYFGAGTEVPFKDFDVLAIGAAVPDLSAEFDLYWNSASAYPAARLLDPAGDRAQAALAARFEAARADPLSRAYIDAVRDTPILAGLLRRDLPFEWVEARVVADDPRKTLDQSERTDLLLLARLMATDAPVRRTFDLISPYFVPGDKGTEALEAMARSGVRIRVLTNSFTATDVSVVHAGYSKRRVALARAGVKLHELKGTLERESRSDGEHSGSSSARLHAKTFAADGERIFVGSFNFDPRSAFLNTEMGLVIESRVLAGRLSELFDTWVPQHAYEVRLRGEGDELEWIERVGTSETRFQTEPDVSWGRRAWLGFLGLLPIDWLL